MPCSGGGPSDYECEREENNQLRDRIKKLEGMVCDACTVIADDLDKPNFIPASCSEWWEKHERAEAEKLKRIALGKLTPRERRLLGLK